jgi:vacuolar-type H+-ATPase subunit D/Vma8
MLHIVIVMAIIYATFQMMQLHERSSSRLNALEQDVSPKTSGAIHYFTIIFGLV